MKIPYSCEFCGRFWLREVPDNVKCVYWMSCICGGPVEPGEMVGILHIQEEVAI